MVVKSPNAYVICGITASGKTSLAKQYVNPNTYLHTAANSDMLAVALTVRADIVWDQSNSLRSERELILALLKSHGYRIHCLSIQPPMNQTQFDDWRSRIPRVPTKAVRQIINSFEPPTLDEGFDTITYYSIYGESLNAC